MTRSPACILDSMIRIGMESHKPITPEEARERMKKAVRACEQHKLLAVVNARKIIADRRAHETRP